MNILHIITKGEIGGAQQVVLSLARQQRREGHHVTIAWGEGDYLRDICQKEKINYFNFTNLKRSYNPLSGLFFINEARKYSIQNNFDIVHFHSSNTIPGAIGIKMAKKASQTIFTFHGLSVLDSNYETNIFLRSFFWLYFKFFLLFINKKIFVCNYNLEIAKKIRLIPDGEVVYNAIDSDTLNFYSKEEAQKIISQKYHLDLSDKFIIGSIGRLAYPKNYEFLISIFPEIIKIKNNAIGIIVGEGPERQKYEKLIDELNLKNKIHLIGEIKNASDFLKMFDLFVLPSKYEGLSMTLLETKVAGVEVLASNVGGSCEILDNSNIYNLDDASDFLQKLTSILPSK